MLLRRALFFLVTLAVNCAAMSGQTGGVDPTRLQLLKLLPESLPAEVTSQGAASFYTSDNLFQYMDGGAGIFLVYGVQMLLHKDLRAGMADIALDIFDMGSPDTAFGMYAAERTPDDIAMKIRHLKNLTAVGVLSV